MTNPVPTRIELALSNRLRLLVLDPPLLVAWPNKTFPEGGGSPPAQYLRAQHFPNTNQRPFLADSDPTWRRGIYQITVISPLAIGWQRPSVIAGLVAEHFAAQSALFSEGTRVDVTKYPDVASPLENNVSWDVPVSVYYEAFA